MDHSPIPAKRKQRGSWAPANRQHQTPALGNSAELCGYLSPIWIMLTRFPTRHTPLTGIPCVAFGVLASPPRSFRVTIPPPTDAQNCFTVRSRARREASFSLFLSLVSEIKQIHHPSHDYWDADEPRLANLDSPSVAISRPPDGLPCRPPTVCGRHTPIPAPFGGPTVF